MLNSKTEYQKVEMSVPLGTMYFLLDKSSLDRKSLQAMQTIASVSTYFFIHMAYDIVNLLWPSMAVSPKKFPIVELTPVSITIPRAIHKLHHTNFTKFYLLQHKKSHILLN